MAAASIDGLTGAAWLNLGELQAAEQRMKEISIADEKENHNQFQIREQINRRKAVKRNRTLLSAGWSEATAADHRSPAMMRQQEDPVHCSEVGVFVPGG